MFYQHFYHLNLNLYLLLNLRIFFYNIFNIVQNVIFKGIKEIKNEICLICLGKVCEPVKPTNCKHIFCRRCFETYFQIYSKCPTCKKPLDKYEDIFTSTSNSNKSIKSINHELEDKLYRLSKVEYPERHCVVCRKSSDKEHMILCERCYINEAHYYCDSTQGLALGKYICPICRHRFYNHLK